MTLGGKNSTGPSRRGGPRPNSGRKPSSIVRRATTVWLSEQERALLKALGGSKWLRQALALDIPNGAKS